MELLITYVMVDGTEAAALIVSLGESLDDPDAGDVFPNDSDHGVNFTLQRLVHGQSLTGDQEDPKSDERQTA